MYIAQCDRCEKQSEPFRDRYSHPDNFNALTINPQSGRSKVIMYCDDCMSVIGLTKHEDSNAEKWLDDFVEVVTEKVKENMDVD